MNREGGQSPGGEACETCACKVCTERVLLNTAARCAPTPALPQAFAEPHPARQPAAEMVPLLGVGSPAQLSAQSASPELAAA